LRLSLPKAFSSGDSYFAEVYFGNNEESYPLSL